MATSTMDWDMEVDDAVVADPIDTTQTQTEAPQIPAAYYESLVDEPNSAVSKVHIRGIDILTTKDIRNYVREHFGEIAKVEWIDDTSANLIPGSGVEATTVLAALASVDIVANPTTSPEDLYPAKSFSEKPDVTLSVRLSLLTDKKEVGAAQRSRFYLLNPEYDPEERAGAGKHTNNGAAVTTAATAATVISVMIAGAGTTQTKLRHTLITSTMTTLHPGNADALQDQDPQRKTKGVSFSQTSRLVGVGEGNSLGWMYCVAGQHRPADGMVMIDLPDQSASVTWTGSVLSRNNRDSTRAKELFPVKSLIKEASESGRLNSRSSHEDATRDRQYTGFAIKGASQSGVSVKELFPARFGSNANKELFAEKLQGRDRRRQRADDNW